MLDVGKGPHGHIGTAFTSCATDMRQQGYIVKIKQPGCYFGFEFEDIQSSSTKVSIGHVSPEAAQGGNIALIEDGDEIAIDIDDCSIELCVSDQELQRRRDAMNARGADA